MLVRVDQAGHHDHPGGVDDLRAGRVQVGPDGGDPTVLDEDVGRGEVTQCGIVFIQAYILSANWFCVTTLRLTPGTNGLKIPFQLSSPGSIVSYETASKVRLHLADL